jgi:hypothetical protein
MKLIFSLKKSLLVAVAGVLVLSTVACTQDQLTLTLDAITTAADIAISVATGYEGVNGSTQVAAEVISYAKATSLAVAAAVTELQSKDAASVKIGVITADFAGIVAPQLGAQFAQSSPIFSAVISVQSDIQLFISQLNSAKQQAALNPTAAQKISAQLPVLSRHRLNSIQSHAIKTVKAAEEWQLNHK